MPRSVVSAVFVSSAGSPPRRPAVVLATSTNDDEELKCPKLARFLGIVIGMFYREHGVAHLHAVYGEHEISVEVETGRIHGDFPPRALKLVLEWVSLHTAELLENWQLAKQGQPLKRIAPLE